ncbi:MAG: DUF2007 domain-containing protein [Xanthomonadales bacterium]|nr:DUF2007 domain-containing protein [Xanthomonadales bacterium]
MLKVFEHFDLATVGHYQSVLEAEGIPTHLKNQYLTGALGDLPFVEAVPELWIINEKDLARANALIRGLREAQAQPRPDWSCPTCQAVVEGVFASCWKCQAPRPEDGA